VLPDAEARHHVNHLDLRAEPVDPVAVEAVDLTRAQADPHP